LRLPIVGTTGRKLWSCRNSGEQIVASESYSFAEKSIAELSADLAAGRVTSERLVKIYLARIEKIDRAGAELRSVLAINPHAVLQARALDAERRSGKIRGRLHGIPFCSKTTSKPPILCQRRRVRSRLKIMSRNATLV
jgi:hypothetical protein